jgi:hypothetical protein
MHPRLGISFLLLVLFVALSANLAWACGDTNADHVAKFHHEHDAATHKHEHETTQAASHCSDAAGHNEDRHSKPCSDDERGHCHCPGCGMACHAPAVFVSSEIVISSPLIYSASAQRQAFYFADHLPQAVYLPIWQPPKWVA